MRILIDMNLSPEWVAVFEKHGWKAKHWSETGNPRASDKTIMDWAHENRYIVFTHDLDFGALLATTHAQGPSVFQIRIQNVMPGALGKRLVGILEDYEELLNNGALITVDAAKERVRILPFK